MTRPIPPLRNTDVIPIKYTANNEIPSWVAGKYVERSYYLIGNVKILSGFFFTTVKLLTFSFELDFTLEIENCSLLI